MELKSPLSVNSSEKEPFSPENTLNTNQEISLLLAETEYFDEARDRGASRLLFMRGANTSAFGLIESAADHPVADGQTIDVDPGRFRALKSVARRVTTRISPR